MVAKSFLENWPPVRTFISVVVRICYATPNCGAMTAAGTKALTLAGREEEEKDERNAGL